MKKNVSSMLAAAALLAIAALWGSTFVVIKDTVTRLPVPDMLALRFGIAAAVLALVAGRSLRADAATIRAGVVIGLCFGAGQVLQTLGLRDTAPSVSGFLTGSYVVFTPLLAHAVFGDRVKRVVWAGVALATLGLAVLSVAPDALASGLGGGAALTLAGAVCYAAQIVFTGRYATRENATSLTVWQAVVVAAMCAPLALPGGLTLPATMGDWGAVVYLAVACGALTLFLQNWAQSRIDTTKAAVIMCLEPVWAAVISVAVGFEGLTWRLVLGGALMVAAMLVIVAVPDRSPARLRRLGRVPVGADGELGAGPLEPGPLVAEAWVADAGVAGIGVAETRLEEPRPAGARVAETRLEDVPA